MVYVAIVSANAGNVEILLQWLRQELPESVQYVHLDGESDVLDGLRRLPGQRVVVIDGDSTGVDAFQLLNQIVADENLLHASCALLLANFSDQRCRLHRHLIESVELHCKPLERSRFVAAIASLVVQQQYVDVFCSLRADEGATFAQLQEGVIALAPDGSILFANALACRLLRCTMRHVRGLNVATLFEESNESVSANWQQHPLAQAMGVGTAVQVQKTRLWRADGGSVSVTLALMPVSGLADIASVLAFRPQEVDKHTRDRLAELAHMDWLTGLPSRQRFDELLLNRLDVATGNLTRLAVVLVALDHFRHINDTLGHDFGDHLLKAVAQRLRRDTPGAESLARLDGDRFLLALGPVVNPMELISMAHQIRDRFREPFLLQGHEIFLSASLGCAIYPSCGDTTDLLIGHAEASMLRAKALGRNCLQFYSVAVQTLSAEWLTSNSRHITGI